ncbi:type-F conjugative transfer system pilin assembly protein TraF, partial [Salmonella enterica subsp. enterica serovar Schwarzengrund]|nr:type-F conjugative transfer system pilin assembly protein TraF [Salmonella enterica subsp. enterica serovar Schwarzengrund]
MRKPALITLLCLCAAAAGAQPGAVQPQTHTYVDDPLTGWHWYNEPQPE